MFDDASILITGGTGSFGKTFAEYVLKNHKPKRVIIFSRDELKQHEMQVGGFNDEPIRFFLGDIRDPDRLRRAFHDVDIVIHAAALKQVPACEYNPIEAVLTNIMGARHIIEAALDAGVKKVMALSTDKAVSPVNLYGATKLAMEKLIVQANAYSGGTGTRFSCVRYGNVVASRGSVIPLFLNQRKSGRVTITDPRMTRFWITLPDAVKFVAGCLEQMQGGETFVPKLPSMNIMDLARAVAPECDVDVIGIRPGEKLHEVLISEDESRNTRESDRMYVIWPPHPSWTIKDASQGKELSDGFRYSSDDNPEMLGIEGLRALVKELEEA